MSRVYRVAVGRGAEGEIGGAAGAGTAGGEATRAREGSCGPGVPPEEADRIVAGGSGEKFAKEGERYYCCYGCCCEEGPSEKP